MSVKGVECWGGKRGGGGKGRGSVGERERRSEEFFDKIA